MEDLGGLGLLKNSPHVAHLLSRRRRRTISGRSAASAPLPQTSAGGVSDTPKLKQRPSSLAARHSVDAATQLDPPARLPLSLYANSVHPGLYQPDKFMPLVQFVNDEFQIPYDRVRYACSLMPFLTDLFEDKPMEFAMLLDVLRHQFDRQERLRQRANSVDVRTCGAALQAVAAGSPLTARCKRQWSDDASPASAAAAAKRLRLTSPLAHIETAAASSAPMMSVQAAEALPLDAQTAPVAISPSSSTEPQTAARLHQVAYRAGVGDVLSASGSVNGAQTAAISTSVSMAPATANCLDDADESAAPSCSDSAKVAARPVACGHIASQPPSTLLYQNGCSLDAAVSAVQPSADVAEAPKDPSADDAAPSVQKQSSSQLGNVFDRLASVDPPADEPEEALSAPDEESFLTVFERRLQEDLAESGISADGGCVTEVIIDEESYEGDADASLHKDAESPGEPTGADDLPNRSLEDAASQLVEAAPSECRLQCVFTGIPLNERQNLKEKYEEQFGSRVSFVVDGADVVVVRTDENLVCTHPTSRFTFAIADKKMVVSERWLIDSSSSGSLLAPEQYEVRGEAEFHADFPFASRRSRLSPTRLFDGYVFCFSAYDTSKFIRRERLMELTVRAGGAVEADMGIEEFAEAVKSGRAPAERSFFVFPFTNGRKKSKVHRRTARELSHMFGFRVIIGNFIVDSLAAYHIQTDLSLYLIS